MCSGSTVYTALKESQLRPGNWAVFLGGGGGVGIQGVQLAAAMGMRPIVVDTGGHRRDLALSVGAEHFVDFLQVPDPVQEALDITGGGADGVFVTGKTREYPILDCILICHQPYKAILKRLHILEVVLVAS